MGDVTTDTTNTGNNDAARRRSRREVTPPPQDDAHLNLVVQKAVDASIETAIANALRPVLEEMICVPWDVDNLKFADDLETQFVAGVSAYLRNSRQVVRSNSLQYLHRLLIQSS